MFSLSTSWNYSRHTTGAGLLREIKALGFDAVELNFALTEEIVNDIVALKDASEIKITSLHNICPLPKEAPAAKASPDYYSLASEAKAERRLAVLAAMNTVKYASRLGANVVVLHAGRVETKDRTGELVSVFNDSIKADAIRREMFSDRADKRGAHLKSVLDSLTELVPYAKEMGISLALENRYYYREIPLQDELEEIFSRFGPGDLYYWHDVGHAEVFDRLGLGRHRDLLDKFSKRLIGMHLHDIIGLIDDHKVPGAGTFDFKLLRPYLKKDTIKVLEVHMPADGDDIVRSVRFLSKILC